MTKEEAVKRLKEARSTIQPFRYVDEAIDYAIKALEQEPCDDAISRKDALRAFMCATNGERLPDYDCDNYPVTYELRYIKKTLRALPPVNPQPKTGHWIDTGSGQECSECGEIQYGYDSFRHFCANCGSRMEVYDATDN